MTVASRFLQHGATGDNDYAGGGHSALDDTRRAQVAHPNALAGAAVGQARFGFDIDRSIEDIDQAMEKVAKLRATTGARLNTIDAQRRNNEDMRLNLETLRSRLEDVDLTAAISQLAQESSALEAAQAAFVRVQGLSLFNFL
jgi:flagellin-like hook-associated protein FlgL